MELTEAEKNAIRAATYNGLTGDALLKEVTDGRLFVLRTGRQSFTLKPTNEVPESIRRLSEKYVVR
ncbi:hypothetical protein [Burkholderia phage FLC9]|nr:hypothetical protein [Burkholderia phage FLC9]